MAKIKRSASCHWTRARRQRQRGKGQHVGENRRKLHDCCGCDDLPNRIDLLLVAGGPGCFAAAEDKRITSWIRRLEPRCARVGSVCTGSSVLLATGITNGHKIATHWLEAMRLKAHGPFGSQVEPDAIFLTAGKFWTSAGMLAGIDLALAVIEADHGRQLGVSPSIYRASFGTDNAESDDATANDAVLRMDLENVVNGKSVW